MDKKQHWDQVYATKQPNEVSWTQEVPQTSLEMIQSFRLPKAASIIDVGGGDSKLVDHLLDEGYTNITVLDISERAISKAKDRLGKKASTVHWIVADITDFVPQQQYDLWHDRATFHFLTSPDQVSNYVATVNQYVSGYLVIGTFSENGPTKCSGLPVHRYNEEQMMKTFTNKFLNVSCITQDHITPFNTKQNFIFCSFKKKK